MTLGSLHRRHRCSFAAGAGLVLALLGIVGFVAAPSSADVTCTLYASPTGSDSGSGTSTSPFLTAQKLVSSLASGQTGCLLGGTYTGNLTIRVSGVTLTTAPGSPEALLTGGYVYVPAGTTGVTIAGVKIDGKGSTAISVQLFGDDAALRNDDITNEHASQSCITVGDYEGTYKTTVSGVVLDGNVIHGCGMLADGNHDHGIYLASTRNAQVTNNVLYDNVGGWGIQLWADAHYSLVSHNVLDGNYGGNIIVAGGNYSSLGPSSDNTFTYNILTWPQTGYNVASYWEGTPGTNNVFTDNCVYGGVDGDYDYADGGFTESGTVYADPQYTNRSAHDYSLRAGSPCAGMGPTGGSSTTTTTTTSTTTTTTTTTTTAASPDFSVADSPSSLVVYRGSSVADTVTVTGSGGFSGTVSFTVTGLPAGVGASFSPGSITGGGSARLTLSASSTAVRGTFTLTITGTSGGVSHSVALSLRVHR